jgi:chromosomal replication initiator protein
MAGQDCEESLGIEARLREAIAERLGRARYGLWFGEGVRLGLDSDGAAMEVGVPNAFFREWIQGHFASSLIEAAEAVTGRTLGLTIRVDGEAGPEFGPDIDTTRNGERPPATARFPLPPGVSPNSPLPQVHALSPLRRAADGSAVERARFIPRVGPTDAAAG